MDKRVSRRGLLKSSAIALETVAVGVVDGIASAARVGQQFGTVAPGIVQYTTDVLSRDL